MSKVQLVKTWLCIGILFAFLSGGTVSWVLSHVLRSAVALPERPETRSEWRNRFVAEINLDLSQIETLDGILDRWEEERLELQQQYRDLFKDLNKRYEEEEIEAFLTLDQLELFKRGGF